MLINPLLLVDKLVRVKFENCAFDDCPGFTEKKGATYYIIINARVAEKVSDDIRKYFVLGIMYHEVAHIKYDSFKRKTTINNDIFNWIDNLLEDARVEFKCASEYPIAAKFINIALNTTKAINNVIIDGQKQTKLQKMLNDMYLVVRYGIIPNDADEDFINFMFPLFLSSMRGEREYTEQAAEMIYEYLMIDFDRNSNISIDFTNANNVFNDKVDNNDIKQLGEQIIEKESTISLREQIEHIVAELEQNFGTDAHVIDDIVTEVLEAASEQSKFYSSCVRELSNEIATLTNVLRSLITQHSTIEVHDGDINVKKQMQAYLDSIFGEQNKTYTCNKLNIVDFDCLILRDTSGSTVNFKFEYFKSLVVVVEALENLKIRNMVVDFNSDVRIVKTFDEDKKEDKFTVGSFGDTCVVAALNSIKSKVNWKSKRRLVIIITDGMFSDGHNFGKILCDEKYMEVNWVIINIGNISNNVSDNFRYSKINVSNVKQIPEAFAKIIHEIQF